MVKFEDYYYKDISARTGISPSHLSEIVNYKNYPNKGLNEKHFVRLLQGGIITVEEVKSHVELTEAEGATLDRFKIHEFPELVSVVIQLREAGHDPLTILKQYAKDNNLKL